MPVSIIQEAFPQSNAAAKASHRCLVQTSAELSSLEFDTPGRVLLLHAETWA